MTSSAAAAPAAQQQPPMPAVPVRGWRPLRCPCQLSCIVACAPGLRMLGLLVLAQMACTLHAGVVVGSVAHFGVPDMMPSRND